MITTANVAQPQPQSAARRQLEFLKRQVGLIVLLIATAVAAAAAASLTQAKVYRASSKISVLGTLNPQFGNVIQPFTQTMSSLLKSDIVARKVIDDLSLNETPDDLLRHLSVSSTPDSAVLQVTYDSHDRAEAVRVLAEVGTVFTALVRKKLGQPGAPEAPVVNATVFDPAHASANPVSPHPVQTMVFAGIVGLALGLVLARLRDALDERIRRRDEMEAHFGAPVVAALPKSVLGRPVVDRGGSVDLTHLQGIDFLRLQLVRDASPEKVVTVTGSSGDGKSTVAASLAVALALSGERVICVDVTPGRHSLSHYLNVQDGDRPAAGALRGSELERALRDVKLEAVPEKLSLESVPTGQEIDSQRFVHELTSVVEHGRSGRIQLLALEEGSLSGQDGFPSWSIADLVTELKSQADFVVVDAPSVPSAATFAVLSVSDNAVIVAREGRTTKEQARSVRSALEALQIPNAAVVSIGGKATPVPAYGRSRTGSRQAPSSKRARRAR
jgi:capsular polysaccharide biosynthesis protein/MinD-like ATPase involved in chromosome partitioning or flagellar assembly